MSRPATARQATMPTPPGSPPVRVPLLTTPSTGAVPLASPTSPRSGFLGSFMRGRSRAQSVTNAVAGAVRQRVGSPGVEQVNNDGGDVTRSVSSPNADAAAAAAIQIPPVDPTLRRTHKIRLVPVLETNRSFTFAPVLREMGVMHVPPGVLPSIAANAVTEPGPTVNGRQPPLLIKIGRFTDKAAGAAVVGAADMITSGITRAANGEQVTPATAAASAVGGGGGDTLSPRAAFKSKVVSRSHAEIWCEPGGKFYIRDTASSSGTFLNHIRLSSPNVQSRPQLLKDGDVLQLGVDYQGGAEEMYRCVKMRVEVGREWQSGANEFNTNALKQLKALGGGEHKQNGTSSSSRAKKASVTDCCICLFSVTVCQSLFIAPCSHVFHYKCIRPLLNQHHPGFSCPLCRTFANLDEDVETDDAWEIASRRQSVISRRNSNHSLRIASTSSQAAPEVVAAAEQPSTALLLGENGTASINELLLAGTTPTGIPAELQRQMTAVPDRADSVESSVADASSTGTPVDTGSHATAMPMAINERSDTTTPGGRSDTGLSTTVASLAQTPMNDVFLSTLVFGGHATPIGSAPGSGVASGATSRVSEEGMIVEEPEDEDEMLAAGARGVFVDDEHLLDNVNVHS